MPVPVLIQIAAEKDSSVQRVAAEVNQALKAMGSDAKFDPFTGFSEASKKALADIQPTRVLKTAERALNRLVSRWPKTVSTSQTYFIGLRGSLPRRRERFRRQTVHLHKPGTLSGN